ncbi:MAG: zinc-binding dehydrogenase [bacterium]|nr:zinc-binding dehydrogenase [bacterium]
MKRKYWEIAGRKTFKNLVLKTGELTAPGNNELQIEVRVVGLNFADIFSCHGLYSAVPKGDFTPGLEYSGVVTGKGKDCTAYEPGDRIMGVTRFGAYASHLNIPEAYVWPIPKGWNFQQAAAFPVQALTAAYALWELGNLSEDKMVLVHSAAGGVGLMALDIIGKMNARTIATVGNEQKKSFLQLEKGLDESAIIVRTGKIGSRFDAALKAQGSNGFDIVLDGIGGKVFKPGFHRLNPQGRYIQFGAATLTPKGKSANYFSLLLKYFRRPRLDPLEMINRNRGVMCFNLIWLWEKVEQLRGLITDLWKLDLPAPYVGHEFPFEEAVEALSQFQSGGTMGKVVLKVSG